MASDLHKNILCMEYYVRIIQEADKWTFSNKLCKSEYDFERICRLSPRYIANNVHTGKGNIGTEMLGRVVKAFSQVNLAWLCTGEGPMLTQGGGKLNTDYKQPNEGAMMQVEALNRIIKQLNQ